jgi:hypothetical protein
MEPIPLPSTPHRPLPSRVYSPASRYQTSIWSGGRPPRAGREFGATPLRFYRPDEEAVQEGGGGNVVAYHHPDKDIGSRGSMNEEVEEAGRRAAPRRRSDIDQGETGRLIDR